MEPLLARKIRRDHWTTITLWLFTKTWRVSYLFSVARDGSVVKLVNPKSCRVQLFKFEMANFTTVKNKLLKTIKCKTRVYTKKNKTKKQSKANFITWCIVLICFNLRFLTFGLCDIFPPQSLKILIYFL